MNVPLAPEQNVFRLRRLRPKDLCALYEISDPTLRRWLVPFGAEIGPRQGQFYNVEQVRIIIARLGIPGSVVAE